MADEMTKAPERREAAAPSESPPADKVAEPAQAGPATGEVESDSIFSEFLLFLKEEKKWWLAPLVTVLLLLSVIIVFAEGSAIAPFIYTIF
jgi:hypothetical protein